MAETYDIVSLQPRTRAVPGGTFQNVVTVTFVTKPNGITGMVDIPEQAFSTEEVDKVVTPKAAILEAVKNL